MNKTNNNLEVDTPLQKELFNKNGFKLVKYLENRFSLNFSMENKNIYLANVIDFNLIKLMYELNNDIYIKNEVNVINENEATVILLLFHFFEDLGLPQKYAHLNIVRTINDKAITFVGTVNPGLPSIIPQEATMLPFNSIICNCDIITPHKIDFSFDIKFDKNHYIPPFVEKMIGVILNKIFLRVKQFIENVKV